jgi:hypothetical protein
MKTERKEGKYIKIHLILVGKYNYLRNFLCDDLVKSVHVFSISAARDLMERVEGGGGEE